MKRDRVDQSVGKTLRCPVALSGRFRGSDNLKPTHACTMENISLACQIFRTGYDNIMHRTNDRNFDTITEIVNGYSVIRFSLNSTEVTSEIAAFKSTHPSNIL